MPFPPLTEPGPGWSRWAFGLLWCVNWARTWTWDEQSDDATERTTHLVDLSLVRQERAGRMLRVFCIIIGPLSVRIGKP